MVVLSKFRGYVITIFLFLTVISAVQAKYSGGTGEPNDPYRIATASDLILLGDTPEDYGKYFIQMADIDLDPSLPGRKVFGKAVIAPDDGTSGWPFSGPPFTGVYDGQNYTISNLTINTGSRLGLFGQLETGAEIRNLRLVGINIAASRGDSGGLVGLTGGGTITNCSCDGVISGLYYMGGLVGYNGGASIIRCSSSVAVTATKWSIGGLVGYSCGPIQQSYCTGTVNGNSWVGGLVGENASSVTECYSTGSVRGYSYFGGLVGYDYFYSQANHCFWNTQTSGRTWSAGGTGKTTAQMKRASTFLDAGWDFVDETENGTEDIWWIDEGKDYPHLSWELPQPEYSGGSGTENDPYQIATVADLTILSNNPKHYDKHFILTADIDLNPNLPGGKFYDKAVIAPDTDSIEEDFQGTPFTGVFDGNGYTIFNLTLEGQDYLGLFGYLDSGAIIKNLGLIDVNITASGNYIGGLAGYNYGSITTSYSTGVASGYFRIGGLVGSSSGSITTSFSNVTVSGDWRVGGLVGYSYGTLHQCYSNGAVSGNSAVGGLAGSGTASRVTDCFWDTQTSGQTISTGGTGKTTVEMQTAGTFLDTGWDFVNETTNGTEDIWRINEGKDYPKLWWESVNTHPSPPSAPAPAPVPAPSPSPAEGNVIELTEGTFDQIVLGSDIPVLVDFWAPWCSPCLIMAPVTEEIAREYAGRAKVCALDIDTSPNINTRYNIQYIPTFIVFNEGQIQETWIGVTPKKNLTDTIDELL